MNQNIFKIVYFSLILIVITTIYLSAKRQYDSHKKLKNITHNTESLKDSVNHLYFERVSHEKEMCVKDSIMNVQKKILEDQKKKIQTIQKEIKEIKRLERTTSNIMDEFENYDPIDPNCCDTSQH